MTSKLILSQIAELHEKIKNMSSEEFASVWGKYEVSEEDAKVYATLERMIERRFPQMARLRQHYGYQYQKMPTQVNGLVSRPKYHRHPDN